MTSNVFVGRLILTLFITIMSVFLAASSARAEKMDEGNHTVVIEKLESVLENLDKNDESRTSVMDRLADLYSERARLVAMQEMSGQKADAKASQSDRTRALELYSQVFEKLPADQKGRALIQMAHLYKMQGQSEKSIELYNRVKRNPKSYTTEVLGISYSGLGEIYFQKGKFKEAHKEFQEALKINATPNRGQVLYRFAWCQYNLNQHPKAIETMLSVLRTPRYMTRETTEGSSIDSGFQAEASRDLAVFMARSKVGTREIQTMLEVSPKESALDNLVYLADELDRTGKKSESYKVWSAVIERRSNNLDRLDGHIRLALLQYDMGQRELAASEMEKAINFWKEEGCNDEERCETMENKLRKLVTDWAKLQEDKPTPALLKAFALYTSLFEDAEMNYRAGLFARKLNQFKAAARYFRKSSQLAKGQSGSAGRENQKLSNIFEGSLLGEIEVSELAKDLQMRDDAYTHYLDVHPSGAKNGEVRYQKARVSYEREQFDDAARRFRQVANDSSIKDLSIRVQAADLALDSLVLAKQDDVIESWAMEFARNLPSKKLEFYKIARKALLKRTAAVINSNESSDNEIESALKDLERAPLDGIAHAEKTAIFKNRLIAAEKLQRLTAVKVAAGRLLSLKPLTAEDQELALSRKAWAAEMLLDFKLALETTKKMKMPGLTSAEKLMKLAQLSELAGMNPSSLYKQYLNQAPDRQKAQFVMARLIRLSSSPKIAFAQYQAALRSNIDLYTSVALEVFAKTRDNRILDQVLSVRGAKNTTPGRVLNRFMVARDLKHVSAKINKQRLNASSNSSLKRTMNERISSLKHLDQFAARAVETGDWTLQVLSLSQVAAQNARLAREIRQLPVPRGLNGVQRKQYRDLLAQQAMPFEQRAQDMAQKLAQLWTQSDVAEEYANDLENTRGPAQRIVLDEVKLVMSAAPSNIRNSLARISNRHGGSVAGSQIQAARRSVQESPFNTSPLRRLRELENKAGRETMVAYLDARLNKLESGDKQ